MNKNQDQDVIKAALAEVHGMLRQGKPDKAGDILKDILKQDPGNFDALRLSGVGCHLRGKFEQAVRFLQDAIAVRPDSADTHYNLAVAQNELKRHEEAITSFQKSIEFEADNAEAHDALGSTLVALKRYDEAVSSYQRAIELQPEFAEAHNNLGIAFKNLNRRADAQTSVQRAIDLNPRFAEAHMNLGGILIKLRRYDVAIKPLRQAIDLNDNMAEAHHNLGVALSNLKRYEEAVDSFGCAVKINPNHDYAFSQGALVSRRICDWADFSDTQAELTRRVVKGQSAISPFVFLTFSDNPADQLHCAQQHVTHKNYASERRFVSTTWAKNERIRVAYVSADFREHPVAYQMAELFEQHDRDRFEVFGISFGRDDKSPIGSQVRQAFDRFVDARTMSDQAVAELIEHEKIHIAVDLNGYTAEARPEVFVHRPAPIQVNYLGYPCTMGTDIIDYIIVDSRVAPADHQPHYSEQIVRLPDSYLVTDSKRPKAKESSSRSEAGLPEEGFVFCCFHNSYKITPAIFDLWMRLLSSLRKSVVWLRVDDELTRRNLCQNAKVRGIDPGRLVFADRVNMTDHLDRHCLADLFLDALPYNAHSSASDALWAGLPVLTCVGETFSGRVGASLLHAIGLPELITHSLEEYEAHAIKLANEPELLSEIRTKLADNRDTHPLFDCARFCRHLESAYDSMVNTWQAGKPPMPIKVAPLP